MSRVSKNPRHSTVATGGASLPEGCVLDWSFGSDSGRATLAAAGPMQVIPVPVSTATHATAATALVRADFTLTAPDGSILARNDETVSLYAARHASGVTYAAAWRRSDWCNRRSRP